MCQSSLSRCLQFATVLWESHILVVLGRSHSCQLRGGLVFSIPQSARSSMLRLESIADIVKAYIPANDHASSCQMGISADVLLL